MTPRAHGAEPAPVAIRSRIAGEMIRRARADSPIETCGVVVGIGGAPVETVPMANADRSPYRYRIDPRDMAALTGNLGRGASLFAVYHSHIASPAYPSPADVAMALDKRGKPLWPGTLQFIVSLAGGDPVVRAFDIRPQGRVAERRIEIVP